MFGKILIIGALLALAAAEPWQMVVEECAAENGFGPDMDSSEVDQVEACGLACVMKRLGTMDDNGYWKAEKVIALLPEEMPNYKGTIAAMRKCAPLIGDTDCDTPPLIRQCLLKELPFTSSWELGVYSYLLLFLQPEMV